ncbi:MAG TPA: DNA oxidative demethylase AlkB [Pseudomonadota bacterium]|nr:DNA oxidative demethylase AlkB [Pseudomonadota bacterium]
MSYAVLEEGAVLLRGYACPVAETLLADLTAVLADAPLRQLITPGGQRMSVAMSSCGPLGWYSDRAGYRYTSCDPLSGRPWPALPDSIRKLADGAAERAGFPGFVPDACLINRYQPGDRLSLHQDRDERDFAAPIVSVSLGLDATFQLGGLSRRDPTSRHLLRHGDVLVFGGPSRLRFHGILPIKDAPLLRTPLGHPLLHGARINLTLRRAG